MIRVVAVITNNPGRRDELLAAFRANVPNVHAEKGCIEYAGHIDAATVGPFQTAYGPDSLVVLESWESPEALRAHVAAPHMKTYSEKTKDPGPQTDDSHPVRDRLDRLAQAGGGQVFAPPAGYSRQSQARGRAAD